MPIPRSIVAILDPETQEIRVTAGEKAMVSVFDRSFHFGDSLYEVARSYGGTLYALGDHIARLQRSASLAHFEELPDMDLVAGMVREACQQFFLQFGNVEVYVRTTISRGIGDVNIDRRAAGKPYAVVIVKDLRKPVAEGQEMTDESARLASTPPQFIPQRWVVVARRRNLVTALTPAMKSGNYLNSVLALAEAQAQGGDDALMLDHRGYATEGTTSNFFAVHGEEVWTAPLDIGILAGVTRAQVLETCHDLDIPVRERLLSRYDLTRMSELFLSSSTREVQPIVAMDGRAVGNGQPGPVTQRIATGLRARIARWCEAHRSESLWL